MKAGCVIFAVLGIVIVILVSQATYTVSEIEQVIITQFGRPVGDTVTEAGAAEILGVSVRTMRRRRKLEVYRALPGGAPYRYGVPYLLNLLAGVTPPAAAAEPGLLGDCAHHAPLSEMQRRVRQDLRDHRLGNRSRRP